MKIKLDHYSREKRKIIDPSFMDTCYAGEERKRDKIDRCYWYVHGTKPEAMLKSFVKHTWEGELDLYDVGEDKEGLCKGLDMDMWEQNLVTGGYDRYFCSIFYPEIIAVFKALEAK